MTRDDRWLLGLWLFIGGMVGTLVWTNPNHYLSPDSTYYLSFAGWLVSLDGDRYGHPGTGWDGTFPLGYPLLIGTLAWLLGLSLLVASKMLNVGMVADFLLIWRRRIGARRTLWLGSVLLLGGFLRILIYTWSEWAFLILLFEWIWFLGETSSDTLAGVGRYRYVARLLLLTIGLFLLRYVGGYVVIVYGLLTLGTYRRIGWVRTRQRLAPDLLYGLVSVVFMVGYFYLNSRLSPSAYGGERFYETAETMGDKLWLIAIAIPNELLLFRDYIPGEPTWLVWLGLVLQTALFWWTWPRLVRQKKTLPDFRIVNSQLLMVCILSAGTYLAILFTMRLFSPFNGPNARLMAPVTLPLLMLLAGWFSGWTNVLARRQLGRWWVVVLGCSWLQLLPQADLWAKLSRLF